MNNKRVWVLYGLPENRVEVFTSQTVAENFIIRNHQTDGRSEVGPGLWKFTRGNKTLVLKRQELFGSNDLGK